MEIEIKPSDIDKLVRDAILKSVCGSVIAKHIEDILTTSYNNPVKTILEDLIKNVARQILAEKYRDQVKSVVQEKVEELFTDDLLHKIVSKTVNQMKCDGYHDDD